MVKITYIMAGHEGAGGFGQIGHQMQEQFEQQFDAERAQRSAERQRDMAEASERARRHSG